MLYDNILKAIGKTPLVKLNNITEGIRSEIYVKPEFLNPGGSVKDRIALYMIEGAEKEGLLKPGDTIIEATAGNTGIGLAMIASIKKYRCIFVMPDKMSQDKVNLLRAYGAEVVITPTSVASDSPESYNSVADRLAREIPGSYRPNQFENPNNPLAHYLTTGPEIWEASEGKIDVFVAGMGTGGTISGTGKYLKEKNPNIIIVGADPEGSILSGDSPKSYKVEGIGEDFIPKTFDRQIVDEMIRISDMEAFHTARRLAREEGLLVGGSSGTAVAAALKFSRRLSGSKLIITLLPDTGRNYINKIFSDNWMWENNFWVEEEKRVTIKDVLMTKNPFHKIISLSPEDTLDKAAKLMEIYNISQIPIIQENQVPGSLSETTLMRLLHDSVDFSKEKISDFMGKPFPVLEEDADISELYRVLLSGIPGVVISGDGILKRFLNRADLIRFWLERR